MQELATISIPAPEHRDSDEVSWALSTASSLWASGACDDALRWLRRAAAAANDVEDDRRALELFKAAAVLASTIPPPRAEAPMSAALPPSTRSASGTRMRAVLPTDLRKDLAPKSAPLCSRPLPPPLPPPRAGASPSSVPPRVASIGQARVDAVRVAVFPTREPGKSVVVTLPPGAATPPGATIAMLVPGDFR